MTKHTHRWSGIAHAGQGYAVVYAAEFQNGFVKVGFSENPRSRMEALMHQVRRTYRTDIARFFIGPSMPVRDARRAEGAVLRRLGQIGVVLPYSKEVFKHVDYGLVVNLVNQLAKRKSKETA